MQGKIQDNFASTLDEAESADGILKMSGMLGGELEVRKGDLTSRCTIRSTKGFEIELRALLTEGAQEEVRFERVAVGST